MKAILFLFTAIICLSTHAQDDTLPQKIETSFNVKHPGMRIDDWKYENGNYYLEFGKRGSTFTSVFGDTGAWVETSEGIADDEAPALLLNYIRKEYPLAKTSYTEKVTTQNSSTLIRVCMYNEVDMLIFTSDLEGKNIKVVKEKK